MSFEKGEYKTVYENLRRGLNLSRSKAQDLMDGVTEKMIEKYEHRDVNINPDVVLQMEKAYNAPGLCNYYCRNECSIGKLYVKELDIKKDLRELAMGAFTSVCSLERLNERLIEICEDNEISEDELEDFLKIQQYLLKISSIASSMDLILTNKLSSNK